MIRLYYLLTNFHIYVVIYILYKTWTNLDKNMDKHRQSQKQFSSNMDITINLPYENFSIQGSQISWEFLQNPAPLGGKRNTFTTKNPGNQRRYTQEQIDNFRRQREGLPPVQVSQSQFQTASQLFPQPSESTHPEKMIQFILPQARSIGQRN